MGGGRGIVLLFLDLGARRSGWSAPRLGRFTPRERPGTHCTGGWVGLRAGLDVCEKSRPPPGFDPRTVIITVTKFNKEIQNQTTNSSQRITTAYGLDILLTVYHYVSQ
jgi:hypothetical protein